MKEGDVKLGGQKPEPSTPRPDPPKGSRPGDPPGPIAAPPPRPGVVPIKEASEPRRWPCSAAAKRLAMYAVNACNRDVQDAREVQQESARIAWYLDGLPVEEIEAGTFHGAALDGNEWVELMPEDIQGPGQ